MHGEHNVKLHAVDVAQLVYNRAVFYTTVSFLTAGITKIAYNQDSPPHNPNFFKISTVTPNRAIF
jgi:hypothetical protein